MIEKDITTNRFVALDFEVLDSAWRATVCSIGLAVIENNKITDKFYSLICPPSKNENYYCVLTHGLHYEDVKNSPDFLKVWNEIDEKYIKGSPIIAHNVGFEKSCINACNEEFGTNNDYIYIDTLNLSRKYFPKLHNHKLDTVCEAIKHNLKNYHNALEDAEACAKIFIKLNKKYKLYV